jgi:predicted porin
VDNDVSSTRINIKGEHKLDEGLTFGAQLETELLSNSSVDYTVTQEKAKDFAYKERKVELFIKSKNAGTFWLGQGSMASDTTSEQDVSGSTVISHSEFDKLGRGLQFRATEADEAGSHADVAQVGKVFNNMDGMSRQDRVRYDTPSFGGLQLSASATEGSAWDVAASYKGEFAGSKVAAAVAYASAEDNDDYDTKFESQINGSLSLFHSTGVSLTLATGKRDMNSEIDSDNDPIFYYAKLGYQIQAPAGATTFSLDYGNTQDLASIDDEATAYGIFLIQEIKKVSTELYLGYRQFSLDRPGSDVEDIGLLVGGARVKF